MATLIGAGSSEAASTGLVFNPRTLSFSEAGTVPSQTDTVKMGTGAAVAVALTSSQPWLTLAPTSGTTPQLFTATVNPSGLAAGWHSATVTAKGGGKTKSMTVTYSVGCGPLPCSQVAVTAPYALDFNEDEGGILDGAGVGTGFTYLDPPSNSTSPDHSGYIPSDLSVGGGVLAVTTTAGTSYAKKNSQDNALAVGVTNPNSQTDNVSATIVNPPAGTGNSEQAGIWFGENQDNYTKIAVISVGSPAQTKIQMLTEVNGKAGKPKYTSALSLTSSSVQLMLSGNPTSGSVTGSYSINGATPVTLATQSVPTNFFSPDQAGIDPTIGTRTFAGILTSNVSGPTTTYDFDSFSLTQSPLSGVWEKKAAMPVTILDAGSATVNGLLYSIAGKNSTTHISSVFAYNPATDSWTAPGQIPDLPGPAVENPAATTYNGKIYVFGGGTGPFSGAVTNAASYDPTTNTWTALSAMPVARSGATAQALNGLIYVIGGMNGNGASLASVSIYNPSTDTWTAGPSMETPRDNPGSAVLNGAIYVFGGRDEVNKSTVINGDQNTVEKLDPSGTSISFSQSQFTVSMPTAMTFGPDGKLYVAELNGQIQVFTLGANDQPTGSPATYDVLANEINADGSVGRLTLGIAIDPSSTATNVKLWVADSDFAAASPGTGIAPADSSRVDYLLSSENFSVVHTAISGLPRSEGNHSINALHFGPDGRLYFDIAADTGAGGANLGNGEFGDRAEEPLSAAILVADVDSPNFTPGSCQNTTNEYGPPPATCPAQVWATGLRNTYDFVWASNGNMYGPDNGADVFPDTYPPSPTPPCTAYADTTLDNVPPQQDNFNLIEQGQYYGHPDPYRIDPGPQCVFGDGSLQGVPPLSNWKAPLIKLGDQSVDGTMQYHGNAFGGLLDNDIIMTGFATGNVVDIKLSADGQSVQSFNTIYEGLAKPLPIIEAPDGSILVGELTQNKMIILTPNNTTGTGGWTYVAPMPTGRRTMAVGLLNGKAQLMGGERLGTSGVFPENEQYDPITNTWVELSPMLTPLQGAAYGTINGEVYVAGGGTKGGSSFSNITEGFHF